MSQNIYAVCKHHFKSFLFDKSYQASTYFYFQVSQNACVCETVPECLCVCAEQCQNACVCVEQCQNACVDVELGSANVNINIGNWNS